MRTPLRRVSRGATIVTHLNWGTFDRAVRTEHATVAGLRVEQDMTATTLVEEHARVGRHLQPLGMSTGRAGQHGEEFHTRPIYRQRVGPSVSRPNWTHYPRRTRLAHSPISRRCCAHTSRTAPDLVVISP